MPGPSWRNLGLINTPREPRGCPPGGPHQAEDPIGIPRWLRVSAGPRPGGRGPLSAGPITVLERGGWSVQPQPIVHHGDRDLPGSGRVTREARDARRSHPRGAPAGIRDECAGRVPSYPA